MSRTGTALVNARLCKGSFSSTRMKREFDAKIWRMYSVLPWLNGSYAEVVSRTMGMKLSEYETSLRHQTTLSKYITLPQEWKDHDQETDLFSFVLSQSVDRYIGGFRRSAEVLKLPIDFFVKYATSTEIETLSFPNPQLVPNEPDAKRYQARIYRALLRIFSYPELTTCRCEMESERTIALLFYSFFDWFGTISYRSSKQRKKYSIRIFKRFPIPTWTTEGFAPIVFMSQPLQSRSKEKEFGHALVEGFLRDCEVPMFLVPLLSAVQPALQALLLREITKWTQTRKTAEEQFSLPDWLFIHGIFYDATEIQLYTCTPRITECDTDGVPSKWHFACFPLQPWYFRPFSDRNVSMRLIAAVILLKIQRHTTRICKELQDLELNPVNPPVLPNSDLPEAYTCIGEEVPILGNDEKVDIDVEEREVRAIESLLECMAGARLRSGLTSPRAGSSKEWTFLDTPENLTKSQNFLTAFLQNWRPASELLPFPEDWFEPAPEPSEDKEDLQNWRRLQTEAKSELQVWLSPQKEKFIPISEKELHARHFSPDSFAPDFYLSVPARKHRENHLDKLCMADLSPQTMMHVPEHFKDLVQYAAYEIDAKFAMSSLFMCTPGCWLKCDTESRFPSALATTSVSMDFSLLLHPIQTVPIDMTPLTPDVGLRATILNPALVVGIQGPTLWPSEFLHPSSDIRPKDKTEALVQLATAVEPSLKTHLINWQLRFEQGLTPSRDLPPWFMLFGIIYDAQEVNIVAHIPLLDASSKYSYKSCIVDTISFPLAMPSSKVTEPWYLDRFRVGLALLSIQKHAFHMAQLWEGVVWPDDLISWEEIIEREHLGPVLTPSERGYMTSPDPMWQLYREMHGSDETLDDYTPTASCDDDVEEGEDMDTGEDSPNYVEEHDTVAVSEGDEIEDQRRYVETQESGKGDADDQAHSFEVNEGGLDTTRSEHAEENDADATMNDQCYEKGLPGMIQDQSMHPEEDFVQSYWPLSDQNSQPSEGGQSDITPVEERIESWRLNVSCV